MKTIAPRRPAPIPQILFCGLFVMINLAVPMLRDDLYPFTSAPMFRDHPTAYCNYQLFDPDGNELSNDMFYLQRIYDGNPPRVGVGIAPPPVLEQEFGDIADREQVAQHVRKYLDRLSHLSFVRVRQEVIGSDSDGRIGAVRVNHWTVDRRED